jgi:hypothetical protein
MALSGTSLTVTTLTTAGLLTNNTSGQVSSVTGSTLAALLGGAPTFTGLTLSGLGTGILKVTAGVISLASAGTDYQTPISAGNNMAFTGSAIGTVTTPSFTGLTLSGLATGLLKVTAGVVSIAPTSDYQYSQGSNITISNGIISTSTTPSFTGLTLSGLATGLLKVTAGVVGLAAAGTDYLSALTAGTNITITNNTIATTTLPTFAGINCVSIGNQNTLCGTSAGINLLSNGSGGNTFIGYQAGMACTSGGLNLAFGNGAMSSGTALTGQGYNMAIGTASLYNVSGTSQYNIGIGYSTGYNLVTGSNNLYIGAAANSSSGTVSNEGVINLTGSSTAGRGANTMLINASAGLYSYLPAFWWGYAGNQTGGTVGWIKFASRNMELKTGDNTQLILPYIGWWEINVSGGVYIGSTNQNMNMYFNGSLYLNQPIYFNSAVGWTNASLSAFVQVVSVNSYIYYAIAGSMQTSSSIPFILTAKFISL